MKTIRCSLIIIAIFLANQLHGMEPGKKVKVLTSDEKEYEISEKIAKYSTTLEHALEVEVEEAIPLSEVSSQQWETVAPLLHAIENESQLKTSIANLSLENLFNAFPAVEFLNIPLLENQMILDLAQRINENLNIAFRNEINELPARIQPDIAAALLKVSEIKYALPFTIYKSITDNGNQISAFAWSPDGEKIAFAGNGIAIWDLKTGAKIQLEHGNTHVINTLAWSQDGKFLASGSQDNIIRIYNMQTPKEITQLTKHKGWITHLAWSPDNKNLASIALDKTVRVWDAETFKNTLTLDADIDFGSLAWSPNSQYLACGIEKTALILDIPKSHEKKAIIISKELDNPDNISPVAWSPDGKLLACGSSRNVIIWDVENSQKIKQFMPEGNQITTLAWSPHGNYVAFNVLSSMACEIWHVKRGIRKHFIKFGNLINYLVWSPDGNFLTWLSGFNTIRILQPDPKLLEQLSRLSLKEIAIIIKIIQNQTLDKNEKDIYENLPGDIKKHFFYF